MRRTLFLLSPAHCGGRRAALLARPESTLALAQRLRAPAGAPLGEVFSFISGLYFRGKLAYARTFAVAGGTLPGALVITAGAGLLPPEAGVTLADLARFAAIPIDLADPRYTDPLERDMDRLAAALEPDDRVVLLGSIATSKYLDLLMSRLGERVHFPEAFPGMGDMARGALLLRAVEAGVELPYAAAGGAARSVGRHRPGRRA